MRVTGADRIRAWAEARDAVPVIPMRRCRKARSGVDRQLHAPRDRIERCIGRLEHSRRLATRCDKTAARFLGSVDLACIRLRTRVFVNTAQSLWKESAWRDRLGHLAVKAA